MFNKLIWAYKLMRSQAFVLATDREAVCSIRLMDPNNFTSIILLGSQQAALEELKGQLEGAIAEHEARMRELADK